MTLTSVISSGTGMCRRNAKLKFCTVQEDTIAAIATPAGSVGGIGIVRISGGESERICRMLFRTRHGVKDFKSHCLYHGDLISRENGAVIDEVMISLMRAPRSYTGEDVCEIHCHGNPLILQTVLKEVLGAGARLAEAGEFTKRAFLRNRIDLAQAEAVADLVSAKTAQGMGQALSVLKGKLTEKIKFLRTPLVDIAVLLETSIDFSEEEDIALPAFEESVLDLEKVRNAIDEITSTYEAGKVFRDGLNVVITGRPNVGKSSLLNRLAGRRRAIVTDVPGTTRDFIDVEVGIKGVPVRFTDTAGIRSTEKEAERQGVVYAWEQAAQADLVIILLDGNSGIGADDRKIIEKQKEKRKIVAVNKADLPRHASIEKPEAFLCGIEPLFISAKVGTGIDALKDEVYRYATAGHESSKSEIILSNLRHKIALEEAAAAVRRAELRVKEGASPELPACDVKEAIEHLDAITGENIDDQILERIFRNFCVGK